MLEPLNQDILKSRAVKVRDDLDVIVHQTTSSTNDWCLQQCKSGRSLPFACFAENQTSGKGRRGKRWVMVPGANVALSLSWSFCMSQLSMQLLPLSIAMAVARTLSSIKIDHIGIKWPNDVYVRDRKIAGILIETQPLHSVTVDASTAVVIGLGLNFDMTGIVSTVDNETQGLISNATDLKRELVAAGISETVKREDVASLLLRNVVLACENFQDDCKTVLDDFRACYDYCDNKTVEIFLDNKETLTGVARGVNDAAELLVMIDGKIRAFNSADVSVKTSI